MANSLYEYFVDTDGSFEDTWGNTNTLDTPLILGQTFTIGTVGINEAHVVEKVLLYLKKVGAPAGNLTVELRDTTTATPDNVIATGTIAFSDISAVAFGWYECSNLVGSLTLSASGVYAITIQHRATALTGANVQWSGDNITGDYTGGKSWYSINAGKTFVDLAAAGEPTDFSFQILGDTFTGTLCSYEDVITKAGSGANSIARSVNNISRYIQQAESVLNVRTRRNWVADYAGLNANVKYVLNKIISSLAAIEVINYDTSGYSSRLEAQDMINALKGDAEMLLYSIKDENTQAFIDGL